jgi:NADH-quinone oxidoreductase subunit N
MSWLLQQLGAGEFLAFLRSPLGPSPLALVLGGAAATYALLRRLGLVHHQALAGTLLSGALDGRWLLLGGSRPLPPLGGAGETLELEGSLGWALGLLLLLLPLFRSAHRGPSGGLTLAALLYLAVPLAGDVLTLYLLLEGANMAVYALLARQWASERAGGSGPLRLEPVLGYFLVNLLGSFLLLLGCGCLYLATGTLSFGEMALLLRPSGTGLVLLEGHLLSLGVLTLLSGLLLKLGGAPLHFWVAPIYEGLPLPVFVLLQLFAKGGLLLLLLKLGGVLSFAALPGLERTLLLLGALNLVWGTLGALAQTSLRRLLIYSSLANLGPVLLALAVGGEGPSGSGLLYASLYLATTASLLLPLLGAGWEGRWPLVELGRGVAPPLRMAVTLAVLNLSGVPPFALFFAKVPVALELAERGFHLSLGLLLLTSVVGVAYAIPLLASLWLQGSPAEGRAPALAGALSPLPPLLGALLLSLGAALPPQPHPLPWGQWLLPGGFLTHAQLQEGLFWLLLGLGTLIWFLDRSLERNGGDAPPPAQPPAPPRRRGRVIPISPDIVPIDPETGRPQWYGKGEKQDPTVPPDPAGLCDPDYVPSPPAHTIPNPDWGDFLFDLLREVWDWSTSGGLLLALGAGLALWRRSLRPGVGWGWGGLGLGWAAILWIALPRNRVPILSPPAPVREGLAKLAEIRASIDPADPYSLSMLGPLLEFFDEYGIIIGSYYTAGMELIRKWSELQVDHYNCWIRSHWWILDWWEAFLIQLGNLESVAWLQLLALHLGVGALAATAVALFRWLFGLPGSSRLMARIRAVLRLAQARDDSPKGSSGGPAALGLALALGCGLLFWAIPGFLPKPLKGLPWDHPISVRMIGGLLELFDLPVVTNPLWLEVATDQDSPFWSTLFSESGFDSLKTFQGFLIYTIRLLELHLVEAPLENAYTDNAEWHIMKVFYPHAVQWDLNYNWTEKYDHELELQRAINPWEGQLLDQLRVLAYRSLPVVLVGISAFNEHLPLLWLGLVGGALLTLLAWGARAAGHHPRFGGGGRAATASYECGFAPFASLATSALFLYYRMAVFFVVFEAELVFLLPWANALAPAAAVGALRPFMAPLLFLLTLAAGYVWEIQRDALRV